MKKDIDNSIRPSREDYVDALNRFDSAVCEALAVSQAHAGRQVSPHIGYGSRVYGRLCAAGVSIMRAAPLSRWVEADFEFWDFVTVAGHARSFFDGYLLFIYIMDECASSDEEKVKINLLHLNDCCRRIKVIGSTSGENKDVEHLRVEKDKLTRRLSDNSYFDKLSDKTKKACLKGEKFMLNTRDQMIEKAGYDKGIFDSIYNVMSQQIHILPLSFYRVEANGRGTGIENEADRGYLTLSLNICEEMLVQATELMAHWFPDVNSVRKGIESKFSPGPKSNRPVDIGSYFKLKDVDITAKKSLLSEAISAEMYKKL